MAVPNAFRGLNEPSHANRGQYDQCSVLLFEGETGYRRHTGEMLKELGFNRIANTGDFNGFRRAIVDARKPFVVTLDYVGPDRRENRKSGRRIHHRSQFPAGKGPQRSDRARHPRGGAKHHRQNQRVEDQAL